MDPNSPLAYALGSEIHHQTMSMLGGIGGQLERDRNLQVFVNKCEIFGL